MVDYSLIKSLDVPMDDVEQQVAEALGSDFDQDSLGEVVKDTMQHQPGTILPGRVIDIIGNDVVVEVGLKSEGTIELSEFPNPDDVKPGQEVEVLLEDVESDSGLVELSKRKADRIRGWERIIDNNEEGDTISGTVSRKIKGGLLVDVGVPAFLPASQVDIRRPSDIGEYIGKEIDAKILKIDEDRRNIVISRRRLIEEVREEKKEKLMAEIKEGERRTGVVKNIADFGAFVDLGGIDGLLHITDMSWGRINHPSEIVNIDDELDVVILNVDHEKEKIALGLKQKSKSPWEDVEDKYPVGTKPKGEVVNVTSYGAFVKLEEGLEGLVHISEMSWTRRINHPSEMVSRGDEVEVVVLDIDKEKQEISLGMKQAEQNPWTVVKEKYPPGTVITGLVRNMTNFGAFVEIEEGIDGLLHVSDLSWTRKIGHPSECLKKGQELQCVVLAVDEEKMRVALGLKQMTEDPWLRQIPEHYQPGMIIKGHVTKITNFGVFVELEEDLEGLLHISELADHKVDPKDIVNVGEEIEVKILRVDIDDRKIGLSLKRAQWAAEDGSTDGGPAGEPRRGGLSSEGGALGDMGDQILQTIRQKEQADAAAQGGDSSPDESETDIDAVDEATEDAEAAGAHEEDKKDSDEA
ncbi:MAG: 30S ribosomal protein S1 [Planctomycetes bacterium]|jgi:small subunit ribosomal protein S1|nr:30S ribosomal protein S1 [Planctomycetota bacterium]